MPTSYGNPGGIGNRNGLITATLNPDTFPASAANLIDGSLLGGGSIEFINTPAGHRILFDLTVLGARAIDEFTLHKLASPAGWGTVPFRGSQDGVAWDNLGAPLTVGTAESHVRAAGNTTPSLYFDLLHAVALTCARAFALPLARSYTGLSGAAAKLCSGGNSAWLRPKKRL